MIDVIDLSVQRIDTMMTYSHDESGAESDYAFHEGLRAIPVMGPVGTPPVVVRVHSPYTTRTSDWRYSKGGSPPLVPSPGDTASGHTFMGGSMALAAPGGASGSDGALMFHAKGSYDFVLPQHATVDGKIYFDAHPWVSGIDLLGRVDPAVLQAKDMERSKALGYQYNTWTSPFFDLDILASQRILG